MPEKLRQLSPNPSAESSIHFQVGGPDMRTIMAFLLGIAVTIGAAYVRDNAVAGTAAKPLVNWDQLGGVTREAVDAARNQWNKLTAK
jgi:hypothetical protein